MSGQRAPLNVDAERSTSRSAPTKRYPSLHLLCSSLAILHSVPFLSMRQTVPCTSIKSNNLLLHATLLVSLLAIRSCPRINPCSAGLSTFRFCHPHPPNKPPSDISATIVGQYRRDQHYPSSLPSRCLYNHCVMTEHILAVVSGSYLSMSSRTHQPLTNTSSGSEI